MELKPYSKWLSQYSLPVVATISAAVAVYKAIGFTYSENSSDTKEIPVPKPCYPYIGHLLSMGKDAGKTVAEWHKTYGPIVKLKLGIQDWLFIGDPVVAHNILKRNECSGRPLTTAISPRNVDVQGVGFLQPNEAWNKARAGMQQVFTPKSIDENMEIFQSEANRLTDMFLAEMNRSGQVNPFDYFQFYVACISRRITTGRTVEHMNDPFLKQIYYINSSTEQILAIEKNIKDFLPLFTPFYEMTKSQKEFVNHHNNNIIPFFKKMVNESIPTNPPCLIQVLKEQRFGFSTDSITEILRDVFAGALNTPVATFTWMFAILCNHPEIQDRVFDEISQFVKGKNRLPTIHDRKEVAYCWSVLKESFRFISIGGFGMPHRVMDDFEAYGYNIHKNTIIVSTYDYMHHDSGHYADGNTFNPERFLHDDKTMYASANGKPDERDQFRFGWGRRICPGIYVSEVEMFCAFVSVFSRCKIEPGTDESGNPVLPDIEEGVYKGLTNLPKPYSLKFVRR